MGCWYPGARDLRQLWENVLARRQEFRAIPDVRLPASEYHDPDPTTPDKSYGTRAAVIDGFQFDWAGRRIPKAAYESTDIVHWLALEVALKAVEDAGYTRENVPSERTGVILGNTLTGEFTRSNVLRLRWPYVRRALRSAGQARGFSPRMLAELEQTMEVYFKSVFAPVTEDTLAGALSNTIAGRVCNFLNLRGGGYTVDGACSSSLIAVATAAQALNNGDLDVALAGGVDVSLDTFELVGFAKAGALTKGDMTVYDRRGSGFTPGEGSGFVMLKRLADARRDGNHVYAVIRGWGISSDGRGGITAPNSEGQAQALIQAYRRAGYSPHELNFIEGHGTGTRVGDRTELEGIVRALRSAGEPPPRSVGVTSFKSIVGHTKAAAGIGGFIKAAMAVNRRVVPPTAGCKEPHPAFEGDARSIYPVLQGELRGRDETLKAGVSAMGFGGINCHVTLESGDAPSERLAPGLEERAVLASNQETEVFLLDAGSVSALLARTEATRRLAEGISAGELTDLSAHLAQRVGEGPVRAAVLAGSPVELLEKLDGLAKQLREGGPKEGTVFVSPARDLWIGNRVTEARVAFVFPGQGSQRLDMARTLVERHSWARELAERAEGWVADSGGASLRESMYRPLDRATGRGQVEAWEKALAQTETAQPAIVLASLMWLSFFERLGLRPVAVGGHSLGELTAFHAAGLLDQESLIRLASLRGQAMAAPAGTAGTMASLACSAEEASRFLGSGYAVVANINGPKQVVISGERDAVEEAVRKAAAEGIQTRMLPVSNAFHSRLVSGAAERLRSSAKLPSASGAPTVRLHTGMGGGAVEEGIDLREHFASQVLAQVDFVALGQAVSRDADLVLEIGPGRVLSGLMGDIAGPQGPTCLPVESRSGQDKDLNVALAALFTRGCKLEWALLHDRRLVRPFVPASERVFIMNPCERPFPDQLALPEVTGPTSLSGGDGWLESTLASVANVSAEQLSQYLSRRSGFLAEVVRADLMSSGSIDAIPRPSAQHAAEVRPGAPAASTSASTSSGAASAAAPQGRRPEHVLLELVAARTGYPVETLSLEMRLLDDLNLDSIKAGELVGAAAAECGAPGKIDPAAFANASLSEIAQAIRAVQPAEDASSAAPAAPKCEDLLIQVAAERTGFPPETLDLKLRLLDDLNLDSIKAAELIGEVARQTGVQGKVDPAPLANATLEEIAAALRSAASAAPATVGSGTAQPPNALALVLAEAQRLTGFPPNGLAAHSHVTKDLGLTEEMLRRLLEGIARQLGLEAHVDLAPLRDRTLGQIAQVLETMRRTEAAEASSANASATPSWVRAFSMEWVPEALPEVAAGWVPRQTDDWQQAQALVLFDAAEADVAEALQKELAARGGTAQFASFADAEQRGWAKDPRFSHLIAVLPRQASSEGPGVERLRAMTSRLRSIASPAPAAQAPRRRTTVAYVQFGGGLFGQRIGVDGLEHCSAASFAASVHHERADLRVRVLDVSAGVDVAQLAPRVLDELTTAEAFAAVGYDSELTRRTVRPRLLEPKDCAPRALAWGPEDVVLVTGGAKGITAECALAFARSAGVRMALLGSSPHPDAQPGGSVEVARTLERFADARLTCRYFRCDISKPDEVAAAVARVTSELGPITGVIHGAGVNKPRRVEQTSAADGAAEVGPKLLGTQNLMAALAAKPPRLFVAFTSIIGVTGMPGNAWYAFSNEAVDQLLRRFAHQHSETQILSLAYSVWDEVGMGAKMGSVKQLARMGIGAIPPEDGVRWFQRLMQTRPADPQVVVTARLGGLDSWRPERAARPAASRFLEEVVQHEPGVEAVSRCHLTLERDEYLQDHLYKGSFLFPTVFGLEAMAQVVSLAAGQQALSGLVLEDIRLERPIVVAPERGARIEIRAEVLEREEAGAPQRVEAGIYVEQTGFTRAHFAATYVLHGAVEGGEQILDRATTLDIVPKRDLYGGLLFQGPMFQRIEQIHSLDSKRCVFTTRMKPEDAQRSDRSLLGDAFFRDSLLQAGQLVIPKDLCLPVGIRRWIPSTRNHAATRTAVAILEGREGQEYEATVIAVDEAGRIIERLDGYRLRILEHRPDNPSSEEIAEPSDRDERMLANRIAERARAFGLTSPALSLRYLRGMHGLAKEDRHRAQQRLIAAALQRAAQGPLPSGTGFGWLPSGKPIILGVEGMDISISHDEAVCLCVVGAGPQGCDVAPVSRRSREDWVALLGNAREPMLRKLVEAGESLDRAGTRLWAAAEAVRKVTNAPELELGLEKQEGDAVLWSSDRGADAPRVLTFPVTLTRGPERMIAVVLKAEVRS